MSVPDSSTAVEYRETPGFPDYLAGSDGSIWSRKGGKWKRLTPWLDASGQAGISLCNNGMQRKSHVHRIILESFVGPCPDGEECCHNNGDSGDNRLENIRWGWRDDDVAVQLRLVELLKSGQL